MPSHVALQALSPHRNSAPEHAPVTFPQWSSQGPVWLQRTRKPLWQVWEPTHRTVQRLPSGHKTSESIPEQLLSPEHSTRQSKPGGQVSFTPLHSLGVSHDFSQVPGMIPGSHGAGHVVVSGGRATPHAHCAVPSHNSPAVLQASVPLGWSVHVPAVPV